MHGKSGPSVGSPLIILGPRWVRALFWMTCVVGALAALVGVVAGSAGDWGSGAILLACGVIAVPTGWRGGRSRVRVDPRGVLYSAFRVTFVPRSEIASVELRHVPGLGSVDRAQVAVVRKDGKEIRLDPTEVVRSGPEHRRVLAQIQAIEQALNFAPGQNE